MQAPVIKKNQKSKIIGKKTVKKKSVRNVLSRPKTSPWPLITEEDSKELLIQLKDLLKYKYDVKISWKELKNVSKEKRKERREELKQKHGKEGRPPILNSVIFGINSVTRGLEKHQVSCVLISADVNSTEMVKHICTLCSSLHIPVIVIPFLRLTIKESVGFPTVVMGFKRISDDSPLNKLYNLTCELSQKFTGENYPHIEEMELNDTIEDFEAKVEPPKQVKTENFYLYRNDSKDRCFKPPLSKDKTTSLDWKSDFIGFTNNEENSENISIDDDTIRVFTESKEVSAKNSADNNLTLKPLDRVLERVNKRLANCEKASKIKKYKPANVKRLQSNPNRKKK